MNRQPTVAQRSLHLATPRQLAQLRVSDDVFGDEFDWDESVSPYEGDLLASDMLGCMTEFGAE